MLKRRYITRSLAFAALATVLAVGVSQLLVQPPAAHAALAYNPANLMNDELFADKTTMSTSQIQSFLSQENSGLASYKDVENCGSASGAHYDFYNTYYDCGKSVSAAQIIHDSAQAYSINPQVILATMQKEQSLVTTPDPTQSQLDCAMGYYSCGSGFDTFFSQVDNGSWQFRTYIELMSGNSYWGYDPSSYPCNTAGYITANNSSGKAVSMRVYSTGLYPGRSVTFDNPTVYYYNQSDKKWEIGGGKNPPVPKTITLGSHATAALYCYTPYVGPYSDTGYSGSYNFVQSFEQWFGSTQARISVGTLHFYNQPTTDGSTTVSFTLNNPTSKTLNLGTILVTASDANGTHHDFPVVRDLSLGPGKTYTYKQTGVLNGPEGSYHFFIARQDVNGKWQSPAFDDLYQSNQDDTTINIYKHPTLSAPLTLSTNSLHAGQSVTASFKVKNNSAVGTLNIGTIGVAVRDSSGKAYDFPFVSNLSLSPGQEYTYSQTTNFPHAGKFRVFITDNVPGYGWSNDYPASASSSYVREIDSTVKDSVTLTAPLSLSTNTLHVGQSVTASFTLQNYSSSSVTVGTIGVAVRDSNGKIYDFPFISNLTLTAGQTYTYSQIKTFPHTGKFRMFITDNAPGSGWTNSYPGNETPSLTREIDPYIEDSVMLTAPLSVSPAALHVNQTATATFSVKNYSASSVTVGSLGAAVRDANGKVYDFLFAMNLTLSPGQTYNFSASTSFPHTGKYRIFILDNEPGHGWTETYPASENSSFTRQLNSTVKDSVALSTPLSLSPSSIHAGQTVTASFKLTNYSTKTITVGTIGVAGRDSQGGFYDFPFVSNLSLSPGEEYTYSGSRSFSHTGKFRAFITDDQPGYGWTNSYPTSEVGSFVREIDPTVKDSVTLTAPLVISPTDIQTGQAITATFSLTNFSNSTITVGTIGVAGRDSQGGFYDFPFISNLTLSPTETYNYSQTRSLPHTGSYRLFITDDAPGRGWTTNYPGSENPSYAREIDPTIKS